MGVWFNGSTNDAAVEFIRKTNGIVNGLGPLMLNFPVLTSVACSENEPSITDGPSIVNAYYLASVKLSVSHRVGVVGCNSDQRECLAGDWE